MIGEFVSLWDGDVEISTSCEIDVTTRKVTNIESVDVDDEGKIHFNNGRHRYSALRDSGQKQIPMSLHSDEARENAKKFGYID